MNITINEDLVTSTKQLFAFPFFKFKSQKKDTQILGIPTLQRTYDWGSGKNQRDVNEVEDLLNDLQLFLNSSKSNGSYFAGTTLLENTNSEVLNVIDGQQRVTTLYLLNFVAYQIALFRLNNMEMQPGSSQASFTSYFNESRNRFETYIRFERQCFINNKVSSDFSTLADSTAIMKRTGYSEYRKEYWRKNKIRPRLKYDDSFINEEFLVFLCNTSIKYESEQLIVVNNVSSKSCNYLAQFKNIIFYLAGSSQTKTLKQFNDLLKKISDEIEKMLASCGIAALISENKDDSFRLYEILNTRGQDLSSLDMIKNIILEKCFKSKPKVQIKDFDQRWGKLKKNVSQAYSSSPDSTFIYNIIQTEGEVLKTKHISYFSGNYSTRKEYFKSHESIPHFFTRLERCSEILKELNENQTDYKSNQSPFINNDNTAFQNMSFMNLIKYNWGSKVILTANLLFLKHSGYENSFNVGLGTNPSWKISTSNPSNVDLNHFMRFYSDIVLKIGLIGIITGKSTKELPTWSVELSNLVIQHTTKQNYQSPKEMISLMNDIISYCNKNIFTKLNIDNFQDILSTSFRATTGQKKNVAKVLLYFIYNQGASRMKMTLPELEHIEPENPLKGSSQYYDFNLSNRNGLVNMFGNFALIEKKINIVKFSNKPVKEKLRLSQTDSELITMNLFKSDLWVHLQGGFNTSKSIYPEIYSSTSGKSIKGKLKHFDENGAPTERFFKDRSFFLARLASQIVCNSTHFLDSGITSSNRYL